MTFTSEMLNEAQTALNLNAPNKALTNPLVETLQASRLNTAVQGISAGAAIIVALDMKIGTPPEKTLESVEGLFREAIALGILIGSKATVCELTPDCVEPSVVTPTESFAGATA